MILWMQKRHKNQGERAKLFESLPELTLLTLFDSLLFHGSTSEGMLTSRFDSC